MLNYAFFEGKKNKQALDDFCWHVNGFTRVLSRVGIDFIIHYSNLLQELYLWVNTIKRENAGILQLGVNENAILASICITGRSLEIDWGIMSLSRPQLWLFWPVLWNGVISILGRLQKTWTRCSAVEIFTGWRTPNHQTAAFKYSPKVLGSFRSRFYLYRFRQPKWDLAACSEKKTLNFLSAGQRNWTNPNVSR